MSAEDGQLYIMPAADGDEWVRPRPVGEAVVNALAGETDLGEGDIDELDAYVDIAELRAVIEGEDDEVTFTVEGHEVTVSADGTIDVTG